MKLIVKILVILSVIIVICGCENNQKESITNTLYPMQLDENQSELLNLLEGSNPTRLLSATLDNSYKSVKIFVESYSDGNLIDTQEGLNFQLDNTLDIAIISNGVGNWDVNASSGNAIVSANLDIVDKFPIEDNILQAWSYLNYKVDLKLNEPQIIGICYFDDSESIGHEASVFESNQIENMWHYKYLYVMKIIFE